MTLSRKLFIRIEELPRRKEWLVKGDFGNAPQACLHTDSAGEAKDEKRWLFSCVSGKNKMVETKFKSGQHMTHERFGKMVVQMAVLPWEGLHCDTS